MSKEKSSTPIMDKYDLHSTGGYCTCFSNPYGHCSTCARVAAAVARWDALSPELRKLAEIESESLKTPDGPGR